MDEKYLEQALELAQQRREAAIAAVRSKAQGAGQKDCEDCGEGIPLARRKAAPSAIRCIRCQTKFEKGLKT
jgi:phage/conjugal plasmid C-4 type zinc finger TraR family protein